MSDSEQTPQERLDSINEAVDKFDPAEFVRNEQKNGRTQRHHYVPRFYLRRFAKKKILAAYKRPNGERMSLSVRDVALESDLYTVKASTGETTGLMEFAISKFEEAAAPVVEKILDQGFPITPEEKMSLADYVALQYLRTPLNKRQQDVMMTELANWMMRQEDWTEESVRETIIRGGGTPTDESVAEIMKMVETGDFKRISVSIPTEEWMRTNISLINVVSDILMRMNFTAAVAHGDDFVTTDNPVVLWTRPEWNPVNSVGFETAEEIRLPLSPKKMLVITPLDYPDGHVTELSKTGVRVANEMAAANAYRWVFQHPDGPDISGIAPSNEHPIVSILS
ncbi:MAG: DUF4238 domain-containing protein [Chloroflexi bacterium]|nr:DUF4238 domain-containing protein [Chloroflexota bacterium]